MARLFALTERFDEAILIYEELGRSSSCLMKSIPISQLLVLRLVVLSRKLYTRPKNKQQLSCLRILTDNGPCSAAPGFESLESRMLKYSADEYLFRAALCHLCVDW